MAAAVSTVRAANATVTPRLAPSTAPAPWSPWQPDHPHGVPSLVQPVGEPAGYYAAAQAKQGAALLGSLHTIITTGHRPLDYNTARDAMFRTIDDPANSDTVVDIYTGRAFAGVSDKGNAFQHGLNTEHTWPQSLGATNAARTDLHQLQPSDIKVNEQRASFPYGEVAHATYTSPAGPGGQVSVEGTDATGAIVWQPRPAVRGDIARGLLYVYTRYNADRPPSYSLKNFSHELPTLLKWAAQDPPDAVERERNDAVFAAQGNRNPYVDHPEFVDQVHFLQLDLEHGTDKGIHTR